MAVIVVGQAWDEHWEENGERRTGKKRNQLDVKHMKMYCLPLSTLLALYVNQMPRNATHFGSWLDSLLVPEQPHKRRSRSVLAGRWDRLWPPTHGASKRGGSSVVTHHRSGNQQEPCVVGH
jgi:hypothetical protein